MIDTDAIDAINKLLPPWVQLTPTSPADVLWAALYRLYGEQVQGLGDHATWKDAAIDAAVQVATDWRDAGRYRQFRRGKAIVVVIPTPSEDKPGRKITVVLGPNAEPAWGESLDRALDAAIQARQHGDRVD